MPARHKTLKIPLDSNHGIYRDRRVYAEVPQEAAVRENKAAVRSGVSRSGAAEGVPDRGRPSDAGSRPYDDFDPAKVCGFAGDWVHQGQARYPLGSGLRREEAQLHRAALLGQGKR